MMSFRSVNVTYYNTLCFVGKFKNITSLSLVNNMNKFYVEVFEVFSKLKNANIEFHSIFLQSHEACKNCLCELYEK